MPAVKTYNLKDIASLDIDIPKTGIIFLKWDLGAWKTSLVKSILQNHLAISDSITSPTYTYYNKYGENIYHFDLYRLGNYDEFFAIWWEEILDWDSLCFIEWPELLEDYYEANLTIYLHKLEDPDERKIELHYS